MSTNEPTEAEVRAAGEALEDEAMRLLGRDLGTIHRDDIARAVLAAAARVRPAGGGFAESHLPHTQEMDVHTPTARPADEAVRDGTNALAKFLYDAEGFHAADHWGAENSIRRGRYEALADAILAEFNVTRKGADVIHLADPEAGYSYCLEPVTLIEVEGDDRPICQTCHRGAMKSVRSGWCPCVTGRPQDCSPEKWPLSRRHGIAHVATGKAQP